jgi:hypothetical protein
MSALSVYRTVSFWMCIVIVWVNFAALCVMNHRPDTIFNQHVRYTLLFSLCLGVVGAFSHWLAKTAFRPKE